MIVLWFIEKHMDHRPSGVRVGMDPGLSASIVALILKAGRVGLSVPRNPGKSLWEGWAQIPEYFRHS